MTDISTTRESQHSEASSADGARLSRFATVMLRREGVCIPKIDMLPEIVIAGADLALMAELSGPEVRDVSPLIEEISADWSVPAFDLHVTLFYLRERKLVEGSNRAVVPSRGSSEGQGAAEAVAMSDNLDIGSPILLTVADGSYYTLDHDGGVRAVLSAAQVLAAVNLSTSQSVEAAFAAHVEQAGRAALTEDRFMETAGILLASRIVGRSESMQTSSRQEFIASHLFAKAIETQAHLRSDFEDRIEQRYAQQAETGVRRTAVIPIYDQLIMPLSLGMLVSYASAWNEGQLLESYDFLPATFMYPDVLESLIDDGSVFMFSNYVWSHGVNLESSKIIKDRSSRAITIHGGPDSPKYPGDVEAYFAANPFIDVVVHGEGEVTFAELLAALAPIRDDEERDLSVLDSVPGLSYRGPNGVVRTADRDRLTDINVVPSPYLTGLYEPFGGGVINTAMIETNRGCPYSCTYCDWGSSTASRIRKFDLERIFAELEWCADNKVEKIFLCDANFGIFDQDVQIAEKVAELYTTKGYPGSFVTNYAKNTVKYLQKIVQVMAGAGVVTEGLLSLQSMDDDTLATIRRKNIKVEKYDDLAREFRQAQLPLMVDLMIGLPGATTASVREDFQQCIDREINAKVFQTEMLINSPMNEPSYRTENQIRTERIDRSPSPAIPSRGSAGLGRALVVSSSSFTREDYDVMLQLRAVFRLMENFAVLRLTARYLRHTVGLREADLIEALRELTQNEPEAYPTITTATRVVPVTMVPPVSWRLFIDEMGRFAVERLGVPPGSGLDAVLAAQHAVLPAQGRKFPYTIEVGHDVGAWYRDVLKAKDSGHRTDWADHVPPLESYGPASFTVEDPHRLCDIGLGFDTDIDEYLHWELHSPVERTLAAHGMAN